MRRPQLAVASAVLAVAVVAGCGEDPASDPGPVPLAADERLGTLVMQGSIGRAISLAPYYVGDRVYVVVHQAAGLDEATGSMVPPELRFFEVGDVSGVVTEHPAPPLMGDAFLPSVDVDGNALALGANDGGLAFFDGESWSTVPPPPGSGEELDELVSRTSGRIVARAGTRAFLYDGSDWTEVVVPDAALDLRVGPWDSEGFRLVWVGADRLETQRYSGSTAEPRGEPTSFQGDFGGLVGSGVNGDASSFQIATGGAETGGFSFLFEDGALDVVAGVEPGSFFPAPLGGESLFARGGDPERGLLYSSAGVLGDVALHPFVPRLSCRCARPEDPLCECVDRALVDVAYAGAPSADRLAIAMVDDVEGTRSVWLRVVDLPMVASPFLDRSAPCEPACSADAGATCVVDTRGQPQCVAEGTVPDGGLLDAGPAPFDAGEAYAATIVGSVVRSADTTAPVVVEVVPVTESAVFSVRYGDGFEIAGTPDAAFEITIRSADAHVPITLEVTSPAAGETLDLGALTMVIGEALGPAWGDEAVAPTAVVSPSTSTMVVVGGDGWHVIAADATSASGLTSTHVPGAPGLLPASVDAMAVAPRLVLANDGATVLAETGEGLTAIALESATAIGEVAGAFDLSELAFADEIGVARIGRAGAGPSVVTWEDDAFRQLLAVDAVGTDDWLSPDGAELLRVEGGEVARYEVATGARSVAAPMGAGRWMRLGNGDLVGVQRAGMPGLMTCWRDAAGCDATIVRADGGETQMLGAIYGFAASTTSGFLFYTRRESGVTVPYRFSLATGSTPLSGLDFSDTAFEWFRHGDAVAFQDDTGFRSVEIGTGAIVHTEPGTFAASRRHDGRIVLVPSPCGIDCDMIVLDPETGETTRVDDGGEAVFLGPELVSEVIVSDAEVGIGARTVARTATPGTALAAPGPTPIDHQGAPCWPYSWLELGAGGAPIGRSLYCAR